MTPTTEVTLKGCPFCGTNKFNIVLHPKKPNGKPFKFVLHRDGSKCPLKGIGIPINDWNMRTP